MDTVILTCSSLSAYVDAAQAKMHTSYPVVTLDRKYHAEPKQMREQILLALGALPPEVDTVLVSMGFCGSSWSDVSCQKRLVIPRLDDCITLLLHTDDTWHPNLKATGHFYLSEADDGPYTLTEMHRRMLDKYGEEDGEDIWEMWFTSYTDVDIIDTGGYDCYEPAFVARAKREAELIHSRLNYVQGSNRVLEKLVAGQWDEQFLVVEPGRALCEKDFLP